MVKRGRGSLRKAQISTYMILAVTILLMVMAYFFVRQLIIPDVQPFPVINPAFEPISELIDTCLKTKTTEAIMILSLQGGYITLPSMITVHNDGYLEVVPRGYLKIPYWYYKGFNAMPTRQMMEEEIASYVQEGVVTCTDDFSMFSDIYQVLAQRPTALVSILDNTVEVTLEYPLTAVKYDTKEEQEMLTFTQSVDARLGRLHELARKIHEEEERSAFLENMTINLLALDPDVPFTGMEFSCEPLEWPIAEVQKDIKRNLYVNVPQMRIKDAYALPIKEDEPYVKHHMVIDVDADKDAGIVAGAQFSEDWPFGFQVRPSQGNMMYSRFGKGYVDYVSTFCLEMYHFTYDLSFPILFTLRDEQSFGGQGMTFSFAEPVIISHNKAEREQYTISDFLVPVYERDFCEEQTDDAYFFVARDVKTGMDIESAQITLSCVNKRCPLGNTTFSDYRYALTTTIPRLCTAGTLHANAQGYLAHSVPFSYDQESAIIDLVPSYLVKYDVVKHTIDNPVLRKGLAEDETVLIMLASDAYEQRSIVSMPNEGNLTLELVGDDALYNVTIYLIRDDVIVGGYMGMWNYTYDTIADVDTVIFHVIDFMADEETAIANLPLQNATIYAPEIIKEDYSEDRLP